MMQNYTEHAGALFKTTLVDFPGRVACSFFLRGCNMRCPYCYNTGLVLNEDDPSLSSLNDLYAHLEKRKNVLSGLVISGGEALVNPHTPVIIQKAKSLGYKIKLDTNGTLPEKLSALCENSQTRPDFIAMDIKTSPDRYAKELFPHVSTPKDYEPLLKETIGIMKTYPADFREWRTVLVPPLVQKPDIEKMASLLPSDASWQFAPFRNENCLDPAYNNITPYTDAEMQTLVDHAKTFIKGATLR